MLVGTVAFMAAALAAPDFDAGSDGSYGSLVVPANTSLDVALPADGVIHATDVSVGANAVLTFTPNVVNTPVYLLSQGDIDIQGTIDISGDDSVSAAPTLGGPGGFPGGAGNTPSTNHRSRPSLSGNGYKADLVHLKGGQGGAGSNTVGGCGGGGGGGALLLASDSRITLDGALLADGGSGICGGGGSVVGNQGSGGHIRVVSPVVDGSGTVSLDGHITLDGRLRIDTVTPGTSATWTVTSLWPPSTGATMVARLPTNPRVRIISVAGQAVAQDDGPVSVTIPGGSARTQDVVVELFGFSNSGTVDVDVQQWLSDPVNTITDTATLDLSTGTQVTIPVTFQPLVGTWLDVVVKP